MVSSFVLFPNLLPYLLPHILPKVLQAACPMQPLGLGLGSGLALRTSLVPGSRDGLEPSAKAGYPIVEFGARQGAEDVGAPAIGAVLLGVQSKLEPSAVDDLAW